MENFKLIDKTLTFDENVEYILTESFAERLDIERVILSKSVKHIGGGAFAACENLKSVSFKDEKNLLDIDDGAFTLCHNLCEFDFSNSIETIGEMAFWETNLSKVILSENVKKIDDSAFWSCKNLVSFNVLNKDCEIGYEVIGDCDNLIEGYIAPGYPSKNDYNQIDELTYTLLWLSCIDKHNEKTSLRAKRFIGNQEMLIIEKIFDHNNTPALTGLVKYNLINEDNVDAYIKEASNRKLLEITNLLLEYKKNSKKNIWEDFSL